MSKDEETTNPGGLDPPQTEREDKTVFYQSLHDVTELPIEIQPATGPTPRGVASFGEFSQALIDIGLIDGVELENLAVESTEGVLGLSRALVTAGKLTQYQAAALYQKKSRGLLIGNYLILDKLGQGGMGVVFKARHRKHGRLGALKILPPSFARDQNAVMRFRREVEAASRLKHVNLVAAFDADEDRGVHFLVMDYVEGRDLDRVVDAQGPLPLHQAIDYLIQAARGLEAAHAQGIIHRDIKPGNLILDRAGTVRVLDLGLARIVDANNPFNKTAAGRLTRSGMYMGTVDYMAPEQAEDAHRVDHRADIYSLGCTFYFLLTGREPFLGETILKRLMAHMERAAPSLRESRPDVPLAIEACYQKMMAKRPDDRPASMTEVIALLQASKLPPETVTERSAPPQKTRPELMVFNETPVKSAGLAKTEAEPAIFARREEREGLAINHEFNLEDLAIDVRSDPQPASPLLARTMVEPRERSATRIFRGRSQETRAALFALAATGVLLVAFVGFRISRRPPDRTDENSRPPVSNADSVDNAHPAKLTTPTPTEAEQKTIFDGTTGKGWMLCNRAPIPSQNIQADGLNPHLTGSYLVVYEHKLGDFQLDFDYKLSRGCNSGVFLRVSDLKNPVHTGIEVALDDTRRDDDHDSGALNGLVAPTVYAQKPSGEWNHMTITAQGPRLAVSLNGTEVNSVDLDSWTVPGKRPDGSDHGFKDLIVARMARYGYLGFQDLGGDCWFKNIVLNNHSEALRPSPAPSIAGRSIPAPARRPTASNEPFVEIARFVGHTHPWVEAVSVLPDGKSMLTTCYDKTARLWDLATGREMRTLWHPAGLRPVAALPDGRRAVTGCNDGFVRLWDLQTGQEIRRLVKHPGAVHAIAVSPDGRLVLSGGADKTLRLVDIETGNEIQTFPGLSAEVGAVAFSPNGQRFLAGGHDGFVRWGETKRNGPLSELSGHSARVWDLTFAPDSRHALTTDQDGRLIYWDLDAQKMVRQAKVEDCTIRCVALEADGRHLVFGGSFNKLNGSTAKGFLGSWDLASDNPPRLAAGGFAHLGMKLLPNGGLATADNLGIVRVWARSQTIARARSLSKAGDAVEALAEYRNAIAGRPNNPWLLVERGRLLTELGRSSEADADFTRAARLAPSNPQLFLDAGWWIAGPYAANLNEEPPIEPETAPDPSLPPTPFGDKPLLWQRVPAEMQGHVDLRKAIDADDVGTYALAIVYSQVEKNVVLLAGSDDKARIWLNGEVELDCLIATGADAYTKPVILKAGRNSILAKVSNGPGDYGFHLRLSDRPGEFVYAYFQAKAWAKTADAYLEFLKSDPHNGDPGIHHFGAESFAELGRWKEAIAGLKIARALDPKNTAVRGQLMRCYVATNDLASYQPLCIELIKNLDKNSDARTKNATIRTASLMPGVLTDYSGVLQIAKKLMDEKTVLSAYYHTYGALLFRARQYQSSINFLKRSIESQKGKQESLDWVFLAMARHRLKLATDKDAYDKAIALAKDASSDWELNAEIHGLLEEARRELGLP